MLLDPLAGRIDYDAMVKMADEMLDATKALAFRNTRRWPKRRLNTPPGAGRSG